MPAASLELRRYEIKKNKPFINRSSFKTVYLKWTDFEMFDFVSYQMLQSTKLIVIYLLGGALKCSVHSSTEFFFFTQP